MTERLSTGVTELAVEFRDGADTPKGLLPGSLIAVEAPPGSQVEPLVWSFMTE